MQHNQIATDAAQDNNLQPLIDQLCAPSELPEGFNYSVLEALGWQRKARNELGFILWIGPEDQEQSIMRFNVVTSLDDQAAIMPEGWRWVGIDFYANNTRATISKLNEHGGANDLEGWPPPPSAAPAWRRYCRRGWEGRRNAKRFKL